MIKKKGQIVRLDTPNTTLVIDASAGEYLYAFCMSYMGFSPMQVWLWRRSGAISS